MQWVEERLPGHRDRLEGMLRAWGGNASGSGIANIDNIGDVHPDTYWWQHTVGNVRRQRFSDIWLNEPAPLLQERRQHPRPAGGPLAACRRLAICNGTPRPRPWAPAALWPEAPGSPLRPAARRVG